MLTKMKVSHETNLNFYFKIIRGIELLWRVNSRELKVQRKTIFPFNILRKKANGCVGSIPLISDFEEEFKNFLKNQKKKLMIFSIPYPKTYRNQEFEMFMDIISIEELFTFSLPSSGLILAGNVVTASIDKKRGNCGQTIYNNGILNEHIPTHFTYPLIKKSPKSIHTYFRTIILN